MVNLIRSGLSFVNLQVLYRPPAQREQTLTINSNCPKNLLLRNVRLASPSHDVLTSNVLHKLEIPAHRLQSVFGVASLVTTTHFYGITESYAFILLYKYGRLMKIVGGQLKRVERDALNPSAEYSRWVRAYAQAKV